MLYPCKKKITALNVRHRDLRLIQPPSFISVSRSSTSNFRCRLIAIEIGKFAGAARIPHFTLSSHRTRTLLPQSMVEHVGWKENVKFSIFCFFCFFFFGFKERILSTKQLDKSTRWTSLRGLPLEHSDPWLSSFCFFRYT